MVDYRILDEALLRYLQENNNHWLLNQTLVNAKMRRDILAMLPIQSNSRILDVGTGFGAVSFDLASQLDVQIKAIDLDSERIEVAKEIQEELNKESILTGQIKFSNDNLYHLPFEDNHFDFAIAWFVFQHLNNIEVAIQELKRVIAPGGYLCIVDVDDQFILSYPTPSNSFEVMKQALRRLQEKQGGDRFIGRKLPSFLHQAGLNVAGTGIQAQTEFLDSSTIGSAQQHEINLFKQLESDLIENQILTKEEYNNNIQALMTEKLPPTFKSNAQVIVLGQVSN